MKIEKNIPIPKNKTKKCKYPWAEMEPGDSFVVDIPEGKHATKVQSTLLNSGHHWAQRQHRGEIRFTARTIDDGKRVRVWRTQ